MSPSAPRGTPTRISGLESLRALMAIWVLLGHCGNYLGHFPGQQPPVWIKPLLLTNTPVEVFIVLSGFVIFELLQSDPDARYAPYIARRARRIVPVYFFAVALATICMGLRFDAFNVAPWRTVEELAAAAARFEATQGALGWHVLWHAALLHGVVPESWLPQSAYALLAPAWSLSLEWQFYVLAPLLFVAARRASGLLVLVGVLAVAGALIATFAAGEFTPAFLLTSWPYFALGWWLSKFRHRSPGRGFEPTVWATFAVIIVAAVAMAPDWRSTVLSLAIAGVGIPLCWGAFDVSALAAAARRVMEFRWLQNIGAQSYSLYLLHVLILDLVGWALVKQGWLRGSDLANFALLAALTLALSLGVAALSYRFVERPFIGTRRPPPRDATARAIAAKSADLR